MNDFKVGDIVQKSNEWTKDASSMSIRVLESCKLFKIIKITPDTMLYVELLDGEFKGTKESWWSHRFAKIQKKIKISDLI